MRYSRTWNFSCSAFSSPPLRTFSAASLRVLFSSLVVMLVESSTTTATMFCCGFSVDTLSAGCHSRKNSSAASAVCKIQTERPPDHAHAGRSGALPPDQEAQYARGGQHAQAHEPERPAGQEDKRPLAIDRERILKEKLEHVT